MVKHTLISLLAISLGSGLAMAQGLSNAMERKYNRAIQQYNQGHTQKADELLKKLIATFPREAAIYSRIGKHYYDLYRFTDAAYYFEQGSKSVRGGAQIFAIPLARAYHRAGMLEKAAVALRQAGQLSTPERKQEYQLLSQSIDFARRVGYNSYKVNVENLRWPINSETDEYAPCFSSPHQNLMFTRKVNNIDENFYISNLDTCGLWSDVQALDAPLNTNQPESYLSRSFNNKYILYQKCDQRSSNGWAHGGCDIYLSYEKAGGWSDPVPFGFTINTTGFEGMPCLSADEKAMYFVSDREGGYGGKDIWVSYFKEGKWQVPQNLGPSINTAGDEIAPAIAADGKTLFFSSDGRPGLGGFDIFVSQLKSDSSWSQAQNLGQPVNSPYDELCGAVTISGSSLFMASNRPGGYGGFDIYRAEIPEPFLPKPMTLVYGDIRDFETGSKVTSSDISLLTPHIDGPDLFLKGNKGDGSFYAALPKGLQYELSIQHSYYQNLRDSFTVSIEKDTDTLQCMLLPDGIYPNLKGIKLIELHWSNMAQYEDSICVMLNELLSNYSGQITKIIVRYSYNDIDVAIQQKFSQALQLCFYKIGISDEYVLHQEQVSKKEQPLPHADGADKGPRAVILLEYLGNEE
ncbi:MAG TPA: hypothetical protein VKZ76_06895 [Edaphocola sp.]|nr:hypothetical protein [Edaphocola sp.]